jgi:regulator of replication initiation timing
LERYLIPFNSKISELEVDIANKNNFILKLEYQLKSSDLQKNHDYLLTENNGYQITIEKLENELDEKVEIISSYESEVKKLKFERDNLLIQVYMYI